MQIGNNVDLTLIDKQNKFKTNVLNMYFTIPELSSENANKNALVAFILEKGTNNLKTNIELTKKLMSLYGADLSTDVYKLGDKGGFKISISFVEDGCLPKTDEESLLKQCIELVLDVLLNPKTEGDALFDSSNFETEKENLSKVIASKKDNKSHYAITRTLEEMFDGTNFATYKLGDLETLKGISNTELFEYYKSLLKKAKVNIIYSGNVEDFEVLKQMDFGSLFEGNTSSEHNLEFSLETKPFEGEVKIVVEQDDVSQGKLVIGLDVEETDKSKVPALLVYNGILGGTPNSKMFQNVREKAHLCYVARSTYMVYYNKILVVTGIEIENYEKAKKLILEQLEQVKSSDFTDELLEDTKNYLIQGYKALEESQVDLMEFIFDKQIRGEAIDISKEIEDIQKVTREDVVKVANTVKPEMIYFLTNKEGK